MRPTQPLFKRLKRRVPFTAKDVGKGFYKGHGVGSLGAHTSFGGYVVDYRKVRHFVVPDLSDSKLTPFVSGSISTLSEPPTDPNGAPYKKQLDGEQYLKWWKHLNEAEYRFWAQQQDHEGHDNTYTEKDTFVDLESQSQSQSQSPEPKSTS